MRQAILIFVFYLVLLTQVGAVMPDEVLDDPALEKRAREISQQLRCLVCENETIDESNADLARDLRLLVRERLKSGESDAQVKDYIVERYGSYVLLRPPFKPSTWALWFGPVIILIGGLFLVYRKLAEKNSDTSRPNNLSAEEIQKLDKILDER